MDTKQLIETVTKARRGDSDALQTLYLDMYKSVYYLALRIVKNPEDAEDITQEVYITVQQKIAELREPAAFYGWVNQITVNQCNALLRKYKGMARLDDEDEFINLIDDDLANLPDKALDDEATRKIILEVIDNLPDGQRACVILYYYTQNTISQIADMLETNESTVKSRLALARAKIRAALEHKAEKEGIKLWGIPLALTPILREAFEQFVMPEGAEARIVDFISKTTAKNTRNAEKPETKQINNTVKTVGKAATKMISKKAIITAISIIGASVIIAGVIFLPPLFNSPDNSNPPGVTDNGTTQPGTETPDNTSETAANDFEYHNDAVLGGIVITKYIGKSDTVKVPEIIDGKPVVKIEDSTFQGCSSLVNITTLYFGGTFACNMTVTENNGNINIDSKDKGLFNGCDSLVSLTVVIPNSVTKVDDYAFWNCRQLTSVVMSDSVTEIGDSIFSYCDSLINVTMPYSGGKFLFNVEMLEDGTTSSSDKNLFGGCDSLESVTVIVPASITVIDEGAFERFGLLTDVIIPDSVTTIGGGAFSDCTSLVEITIPDSVTSIGGYVFSNCTSLSRVTMPYIIRNIDTQGFFSGCDSLSIYSLNFTNVPERQKPNWATDYQDIALLDEFLNKYDRWGNRGGGWDDYGGIDSVIDEVYQKYEKYLHEYLTKDVVRDAIKVSLNEEQGEYFSLSKNNDNPVNITPAAFDKVNDFLKANDEKPLTDIQDPKQGIAALWLAINLNYKPEIAFWYNGLSLTPDDRRHCSDLIMAVVLAKYSDTKVNLSDEEIRYMSRVTGAYNGLFYSLRPIGVD